MSVATSTLGSGDPPHVLQQRADYLAAERGRGVAAVQESVDGDGRHPVPDAQLDAGEQMPVERMDAAGTEQADQVQGAAGLAKAGAQLDQRCELIKFTGLDALGDSDQILGDHPARPDVQVADLAVAHLGFGKSHGQSTGVQQGAGEALPEPMPDRGGSQLDGVAFALGPVAPAVQNEQDDPVPGTSV